MKPTDTKTERTDRQAQGNPYMVMPLARVRADAHQGVSLAKEAWRQRDPEGAAKALGSIVEPTRLRQTGGKQDG